MFVVDFMTFFSTLKPYFVSEKLPKHLIAYDSWRRHLPTADRNKVPKLRRGSNLSFHSILFETKLSIFSHSFSRRRKNGYTFGI